LDIVPLPNGQTRFLIMSNYVTYHDSTDMKYLNDWWINIEHLNICEEMESSARDFKSNCLSGILSLETALQMHTHICTFILVCKIHKITMYNFIQEIYNSWEQSYY